MNDNDRDVAELREQFEQEERDKEVLRVMKATLQSLRDAKPSARNELARRYSVAITEYEKSLAFFKFYVVDQA